MLRNEQNVILVILRIEEVHSTKNPWVAKKMNHASVRQGAGEEEKMSDLKFTCTGCRNGCVITVCYNEEGYPDVKGNGCMRGVLYANDKVRAMNEKETDK